MQTHHAEQIIEALSAVAIATEKDNEIQEGLLEQARRANDIAELALLADHGTIDHIMAATARRGIAALAEQVATRLDANAPSK